MVAYEKLVDGVVSTFAGSDNFGFANGNGASARFHYPYSVALGREGELYVSDLNPSLRKISPAADVSTFAGAKDQGFEDGNADTARFYPGIEWLGMLRAIFIHQIPTIVA